MTEGAGETRMLLDAKLDDLTIRLDALMREQPNDGSNPWRWRDLAREYAIYVADVALLASAPAPAWIAAPGDDGEEDSWVIRRAGETTGASIAQMLWKGDARRIVEAINRAPAPATKRCTCQWDPNCPRHAAPAEPPQEQP